MKRFRKPNAAGENNWNAKLTWKLVQEIRQSPEPSRKIAERMGLHYNTVHKVRRNVLWREDPR